MKVFMYPVIHEIPFLSQYIFKVVCTQFNTFKYI